jgi:small subunit ribosomal protein S16
MMAVKIRLQRFGGKKHPIYRVVAADSHYPRDGRYLEIIGQYDPNQKPAFINVDEAKALKWLEQGAQPTDTVKNILSKQGIIAKFKDPKRK